MTNGIMAPRMLGGNQLEKSLQVSLTPVSGVECRFVGSYDEWPEGPKVLVLYGFIGFYDFWRLTDFAFRKRWTQ